jgi:hypothetical protein
LCAWGGVRVKTRRLSGAGKLRAGKLFCASISPSICIPVGGKNEPG